MLYIYDIIIIIYFLYLYICVCINLLNSLGTRMLNLYAITDLKKNKRSTIHSAYYYAIDPNSLRTIIEALRKQLLQWNSQKNCVNRIAQVSVNRELPFLPQKTIPFQEVFLSNPNFAISPEGIVYSWVTMLIRSLLL